MIKLLREIASDSLDIVKHSYHQYKMTGTSDAAIAARKLQAAKDILRDAKLKAISEEKVLLETREKALKEEKAKKKKNKEERARKAKAAIAEKERLKREKMYGKG